MPQKTLTLFDLAPGKTLLDRFEIQRAHRHGGMAVTFEVHDVVHEGAKRELQVFPSALFDRPDHSGDFARAMQAWRSAGSRAIVRVHEVIPLDGGATLLLTDFPPGRSLREWLVEHQRMPAKRAVRIGLMLLDGLTEIHAAGLVHGDVKPNTIQITGDHDALFVDGGITPALWNAKHLGDKTQLIGTPVYAPVEQFGGDSPSVQSDVYGLATVLFELVTGRVPWKGKTFLEVFQAKLDKRPPSVRAAAPDLDLPDELDSAIAGGMMADQSERYRSAAEFRGRLAAVKL